MGVLMMGSPNLPSASIHTLPQRNREGLMVYSIEFAVLMKPYWRIKSGPFFRIDPAPVSSFHYPRSADDSHPPKRTKEQ